MRLGRFDINLLLVLDALIDTKSVTVSAERLNVGQSAMSSALGRLREHFGDELLVKDGRRMELTPFAQSLKIPVQQALSAVRLAATVRRDFDPGTADRVFEIRATDYLVNTVLTTIMQRLEREAPLVRLSIADPSDTLFELLNRGEIDLVLGNLDYLVAGHPRELLFQEPAVVIADRDNPIMAETFTKERFLSLKQVAVRTGVQQARHKEAWFFDDHELKRHIGITVSRFNAVPQFVVNSERVAVTHRRHAEWWSRYLPIKILPLPFESMPISIYMQWNKDAERDPGLIWLRRIIREEVVA